MARNQSSDLRRNLYGNKIFKKILTENALEYLAFGEGFILDRIGDARNLKQDSLQRFTNGLFCRDSA